MKWEEEADGMTPEQRKRHERCAATPAQHKGIIDLFAQPCKDEDAGWPDNDKIADQLDQQPLTV